MKKETGIIASIASGVGGFIAGYAGKSQMDKKVPFKEHLDLLNSMTLIEYRDPSKAVKYVGEQTLIPRVIQVTTVEDQGNPGSFDQSSEWEMVGPEKLVGLNVGIYTWHAGKVITVGFCKRGMWEYRIHAPGNSSSKIDYVIPLLQYWGDVEPGYLVIWYNLP